MVKGPKDQAVAERLPVARVAVDISLAHLDRPFDYLVPASMDQRASLRADQSEAFSCSFVAKTKSPHLWRFAIDLQYDMFSFTYEY